MKQSLVEIRARNVLWILAMAILVVGIAPTLLTAQEPNQVGLAVQFGDGRVETRDINEGTVQTDRLDFVESENLFADLDD